MESSSSFVFPRWTNSIRSLAGMGAVFAGAYVTVVITFGFSPQLTDVGYKPVQPIPYSHALHVGKLGIDCKFCHNTVETSPHASIPALQTCLNCHQNILPDSPALAPLRNAANKPVEWVRVHDLPDYAYFNHSAHVRRGVGCVSCHGRVDRMEVVFQDQPLSMQWCLDCHRNPEPHLRPLDQITNMEWQAPDQALMGRQIRDAYNIDPSTDCSTCHR